MSGFVPSIPSAFDVVLPLLLVDVNSREYSGNSETNLMRGSTSTMVDTLVKSLGTLVRERRTLQRKQEQLAQRQHQLVKGLGRLLQGIGYQLTPMGSGKTGSAQVDGAVKAKGRKRLKCPKYDRHFAHPLPLARHVSASHRLRKRKKGAAARTKKVS